MEGVAAVVRAVVERVEPVVLRYLPRVAAGLVAFGLAAAGVPSSAPAAGATRAPQLVGSITPSSAFEGLAQRGRSGVEASAVALVASLGGLAVAPGDGLAPWVRSASALVPVDRCPPSDLEVNWRPPPGDHVVGAYVEPLGPPPTDGTTRVNGIVACRTSSYAFLGFEAVWQSGRWRLAAVPSLAEETGEPLLEGEAEASGATPAESVDVGGGRSPALPPASAWGSAPLEPLAPYVAQTTCDPVAKPGVLGFRDLLLATFPTSRNLGIGRACEAIGVSEHKEGRAFDWGVSSNDPVERAIAEEALAWMLGPEPETGEPFAIARRLGVMYVIWDGRIWSAFRAADGWRPYVGVSEHRDHIHVSFDWPGARAETSFWRGGGAWRAGSDLPDLPLAPVPMPAPPALPFGALPGPALPPIPLPPGLVVPAGATNEEEEPPASTTTTSTTTTTTTTTTTPPPASTTTTSAPPPTLLPAPPTTIRIGGL